MAAISDLGALLADLDPVLEASDFVFVCLPDAAYGDGMQHRPIATFLEAEGLTLVIKRECADEAGLPYNTVFRRLTLRVPSSLEAVGLTAAVAGTLADAGIPANVLAAYHHDHVFVPNERAEAALRLLQRLSAEVRAQQTAPNRKLADG